MSALLTLTLSERADAYNRSEFGRRYPDSRLHVGRMLSGTWFMGNDYRKKGEPYYGAYPPRYLDRMRCLFPDAIGARTMHLFSGSVTGRDGEELFDVRRDPRMDAHRLADYYPTRRFDLVYADTPYGPRHAKVYGTRMVNRRVVFAQAACVVATGGFMVWLDTKWPMFRKDGWALAGTVAVFRSTNHDVRAAFLFRRV